MCRHQRAWVWPACTGLARIHACIRGAVFGDSTTGELESGGVWYRHTSMRWMDGSAPDLPAIVRRYVPTQGWYRASLFRPVGGMKESLEQMT